ncbi:piwi-like protein Siwi [Homalodisca vitripennis]|uniref:piwi-like protein Siwi n=1 Tax=Homalodisca vitripennis TaxID=197043 RepID=UPI001EEC7615|nr:piwi-like protein Siwi [Homalodisca vitripennis]
MADAPGRARGRARGRAKPPTQGPQGPPRPAQGPGPSRPGPPPSTVGPPPGMAHKPAPTASGRATHRGAGRQLEETAGLSHKMAQMSVGSGGGNGSGGSSGGNGGAPVGRGNMRGKRQIAVTVTTRADTLKSKKGHTGRPVIIQANYFSLVEKTDWCLYQYRVDFDPSIDLTWERKKLLRDQKNNIKCEYIFDGTVLYCSCLLDPDPMEVFSARESDSSQIRITIRRVGEMTLGDHHYLQFFNILTRKCLTLLDLQIINRDYYDPKAKVVVEEYHLELWPGYKTTIRQHENQVLMLAEIAHKVMRTDSCYHLLCDITRRNTGDFKTEFNKAVIGCVVLTDYNNKTYTISDVNWGETPSCTFDRNGTKTSYIDYYKERYNIRISHANQPLLVSRSKARERKAFEAGAVAQAGAGDPNLILLIPELCRMTGLTDEMRSNFTLMRALSTHTRIGPKERIDRLRIMNQRLNGEVRVKKEFKDWNLKLSDKLVEVPARQLEMEKILLGGNRIVDAGEECDWTRHLRSSPMLSMPDDGLKRWVIIFPSKVGRDAEAFVSSLLKAGQGMAFRISEPEYLDIRDDRTQYYIESLDQAISQLNPQLILVVLLNQKADRYSAIKKKTLVDRAVPTQVVLAKNLNKKSVMSIATKVAIQMNCKIGGAPWSVTMPLNGLMVVGFDVCHDAKSKGKSCGAMVASLNKAMTRYFSAVSNHPVGEELSNDLALNVVKALHCYKKYNNTLPSHIIIYRDGVGDGQIPYVFSHEVQHVARAVHEIYGGPVKLAVVLVTKKINTRLFHNAQNPRPGTIVDDVITLPERYDFFIVSQFVNQGTVSPTSYNVIHDTIGLDPDKLQRLTYKMTHLYFNWSGTVRVPAPVQYAHKLAFLVSQSLHRPPNSSLQELLYFL